MVTSPPRPALALLALGFAACITWRGAGAGEVPPIFDTHMHYSAAAWAEFDAPGILKKMARAGVARALVSSTPDEGTLKLAQAAPKRFAPVLRPYRDGVGAAEWYRDEGMLGFLGARLDKGGYVGIGEFHLFEIEVAESPVVEGVVRLALKHDIHLHIHSGHRAVERILAYAPEVKILWAHAGMSEPAEIIDALLSNNPTVVTELSFRAGDVAPGGTLAPRWRALLEKHRKRVMIGTDTYVNGRWVFYEGLIADHRDWLGQLPRDIAEDIAFRNATRLFGGGGLPELEGRGAARRDEG